MSTDLISVKSRPDDTFKTRVSHSKNQLVKQKKKELKGNMPEASSDYLCAVQLGAILFPMSTYDFSFIIKTVK